LLVKEEKLIETFKLVGNIDEVEDNKCGDGDGLGDVTACGDGLGDITGLGDGTG
jgi:hypothetical protein